MHSVIAPGIRQYPIEIMRNITGRKLDRSTRSPTMKSPHMTPAFREENASPRQGPGHVSVMLDEAIEWLAPRPGGRYCDATVGMGGHTRVLLERSAPDGRVIGLDRDASALATARAEL